MGMDNDLWARKGNESIHLADWRKHYKLDQIVGDNHVREMSSYIEAEKYEPDPWNGARIFLSIENIESIIKAYESGELVDGWGNREKGKTTDAEVFLYAKELIKQGYTIWYMACY